MAVVKYAAILVFLFGVVHYVLYPAAMYAAFASLLAIMGIYNT